MATKDLTRDNRKTSDNAKNEAGKAGTPREIRQSDVLADEAVFNTHNDLKSDTRDEVIAILNQHLACTFDLMSQTKQAHWNVKGHHFIGLHKLFDELAEGLEPYVDTLAERITALGGVALGTVRMAASTTMLEEYPADITQGMTHINALSQRYAALAKMIRQAIDQTDELGDADTADMLTDLSRDLDKWLWFLEAHTQTEETHK